MACNELNLQLRESLLEFNNLPVSDVESGESRKLAIIADYSLAKVSASLSSRISKALPSRGTAKKKGEFFLTLCATVVSQCSQSLLGNVKSYIMRSFSGQITIHIQKLLCEYVTCQRQLKWLSSIFAIYLLGRKGKSFKEEGEEEDEEEDEEEEGEEKDEDEGDVEDESFFADKINNFISKCKNLSMNVKTWLRDMIALEKAEGKPYFFKIFFPPHLSSIFNKNHSGYKALVKKSLVKNLFLFVHLIYNNNSSDIPSLSNMIQSLPSSISSKYFSANHFNAHYPSPITFNYQQALFPVANSKSSFILITNTLLSHIFVDFARKRPLVTSHLRTLNDTVAWSDPSEIAKNPKELWTSIFPHIFFPRVKFLPYFRLWWSFRWPPILWPVLRHVQVYSPET